MNGKRLAAHRIRVLVFGLPEMLRDVIARAVAQEPDLELVDLPESAHPFELAQNEHVDVIVTAAQRDQPVDETAKLLEQNPRLRVFCLAPDGRSSWRRELRLNTLQLGEISPQELLAMIRESARQPLAGNGYSLAG